jgi:hypothetical protein
MNKLSNMVFKLAMTAGVLTVTVLAACTLNTPLTICHATSSKTNPYSEITVSINGLNGHDKDDGDIIPAPGDGCPTTRQ